MASFRRAFGRGAPTTGLRLPPGALDPLDELERSDRSLVLKRAQVLGPIFRATTQGQLQVCIMGLDRGRRFLAEHGDKLKVVSPELTSLFPKGFLSVVGNPDHLDYKRALIRGLRSERTQTALHHSGTLVRRYLDRHCERAATEGHRADMLSSSLASLATRLLAGVFFGASDTDRFDRICEHFHQLGPHGFVWNPQEPQARAFAQLRDDVVELRNMKGSEASLLAALDEIEALDDTMIGNLIYMMEIGRFDLRNLLRWLIRYAASDPAWMAHVRGPDGATATESFVLEVLRSDQSERLERTTLADIRFEGYDIPAGTNIRICVWEAHHGPPFDRPHDFTPGRFVEASYGNDAFAPFGLDTHQCPFGGVTVRLAKTYVEALATDYHLELLEDGPPVRGAYHWEPSRKLSVRIERAAGSKAAAL